MKKLIIIFATALILSSCTAVKFEDPQPSVAPSLSEFPEKMYGQYVSDNDDTLYIDRKFFRYTSGKEVTIEAELSGSEAILKKSNRTFILNLRDEDGWDVFPLKVSRKKIIAHYASPDPETEQLILDLRKTSTVKEVTNEEGKFDHYLIAPSEKEFQKLLKKKLFSEKIVFKKLK